MRSFHAKAYLAALCWGLGTTPALAQPQPKSFSSFSELRNDLLNMLGGCTHRIWLTTEYLTDGEIVSTLYIAQYRKTDVRVLLGRSKSNHYMSRLNYLKNQNIPVYLRPESFHPKGPTAILCDDTLVDIDGELDFMSKYRHFTTTTSDPPAAEAYARGFQTAAGQQIIATPAPTPLVGHEHTGGRVYSGERSGQVIAPGSTPSYNKNDGTGAFTYDRRRVPRPEGVPAKLPKELKWKQLQLQKRQEMGPPAPPASSPGTRNPKEGPANPPPDEWMKSPVLQEDAEQDKGD